MKPVRIGLTRLDQGVDLVEHPEGALCLGVRRWIDPHNLKPRLAAVSSHGVDSLHAQGHLRGPASLAARICCKFLT